jgi:hypothetical protein
MLSHDLKKLIKKFILNKNNSQYLETGFLDGECCLAALDLGFDKVISIEIDQNRISNGKKKFKSFLDQGKLQLINGDSAQMIKKYFNENIHVIFLDAHGIYNNTDYKKFSPLEKELDFILPRLTKDCLLIIDDYLKIKSSFFYTHDIKDWKHCLSGKFLRNIIQKYDLKKFELIYKNNSYLILTKDKNFKHVGLFKIIILNLLYFFNIKFYLSSSYYVVLYHSLILIRKILGNKFYSILKQLIKS